MIKFSFQNKLRCENFNFRALFWTAWSNYLCRNWKYAFMFSFENVHLKFKPLYYNKNHLCWDEFHQSWYIFKKPPFRRARWCMRLFLCSRGENKVFVLLFSLAFKSSQSTFTHGKNLAMATTLCLQKSYLCRQWFRKAKLPPVMYEGSGK